MLHRKHHSFTFLLPRPPERSVPLELLEQTLMTSSLSSMNGKEGCVDGCVCVSCCVVVTLSVCMFIFVCLCVVLFILILTSSNCLFVFFVLNLKSKFYPIPAKCKNFIENDIPSFNGYLEYPNYPKEYANPRKRMICKQIDIVKL